MLAGWICRIIGGMSRGKKLTVTVGLAVMITGAAASAALGVVIEANGGIQSGFNQVNYTQPQGVRSTFSNESSGGTFQLHHNVISNGRLGGFRLFRSKVIAGGNSTPIPGTQYLTTGDYPFFCIVHANMQATLHVTGAGTPVARPDIAVTIKTKKLARANSIHGLRVKIEAATKSRDVSVGLEFKDTGKRAGRKANIDLSAGQAKTVFIHFTPTATSRVRRSLAKHERVRIRAKGKVLFGESDSDSQKLGF